MIARTWLSARLALAVSLCTVVVAGCGGSSKSTFRSDTPSTPAVKSFAVAQFAESLSYLSQTIVTNANTNPRLRTGCAQESKQMWFCVTFYSSSAMWITPAMLTTAKTVYSQNRDAGEDTGQEAVVRGNEIELLTPTSPHVSESHPDFLDLGKWLRADGPAPKGHKTGRLTFYYSTCETEDAASDRIPVPKELKSPSLEAIVNQAMPDGDAP
jgi:hypothetical protein